VIKFRQIAALLLCFIVIEGFSSVALGHIESEVEVEIDNLVIDKTQTRIGREFYRIFATFFEPSGKVRGNNIFISEKASARWGSWIWIEVGGVISKEIVYKKLLKPRAGAARIEKEAKEGVNMVNKYFDYLREYKKELEHDLKGNGIY